jgi:hypothetical protein
MPSALCINRNTSVPANKMTRLSYRQVLAVLAPNAQHVMQHILSKANKSTSLSFFRCRFSQISISRFYEVRVLGTDFFENLPATRACDKDQTTSMSKVSRFTPHSQPV